MMTTTATTMCVRARMRTMRVYIWKGDAQVLTCHVTQVGMRRQLSNIGSLYQGLPGLDPVL